MSIDCIISGGQTGVDRAALDFAMARGIDHGGWCPAGARAADGVIDARYRLRETASGGYRQRTRLNVQDSDGTLILYRQSLEGGSRLTRDFAVRLGKPLLLFDLACPWMDQGREWRAWLARERVCRLNVAGPSEGRCPGIHQQTLVFLTRLWDSASG